jgi:hypothetical protein
MVRKPLQRARNCGSGGWREWLSKEGRVSNRLSPALYPRPPKAARSDEFV